LLGFISVDVASSRLVVFEEGRAMRCVGRRSSSGVAAGLRLRASITIAC